MSKERQVSVAANGPSGHVYMSRSSQMYALGLLTAIQACHALDRGIVSVVIEPIKREFGSSDGAMGFISLAYTLTFMLAMLPAGLLIDRTNRVRLLAVLVTLWSGLTALAGLAQSALALVIARMGVGAAEAGGHPTAMSLISDIFPPHRRASAIGLFYLSVALGSAIAYLGGGYLAAEHGWRFTFFMAGAPGLILAVVLIATLREPRRGAHEPDGGARATEAPKVGAILAFAVATPAVVHLIITGALASFANATFSAWTAAFLMRMHDLDLKQIGVVGAIGHGLLQGAGSLLAGMLAERISRQHGHRVGWVAVGALLMMAPLGVAFALAPTPVAAVILSFVLCFCSGAWMPPLFTLLLGVSLPRMRGALVAVIQVGCAIGAGFGPFVTGALSDFFEGRLDIALALSFAVTPLAAFHCWRSCRSASRSARAEGGLADASPSS